MTGGVHQSETTDRDLIRLSQQGNREALEEMTQRHDALVRYVAQRFSGRGCDMEDLCQIGRLGLIKAIRNFDLTFEVRFSTYAVPIVMGEIRRYLRDNGAVHVSRTVRENGARIQKLLQERGEDTPVSEIARVLGLSREDVVLAMGSGRQVRSLEEPVSADGTMLLKDTLGQDDQEEWMMRMEIKRLLSSLAESDRSLIIKRYFAEETQARIARERGMTQVQVSRLESKILRKMREMAGMADQKSSVAK